MIIRFCKLSRLCHEFLKHVSLLNNGPVKIFLTISIFAFSFNLINGQQTPLYPVSYRIFNPFIFNPAIAGSKDFCSIDFIAGNYDKSNSQILGGNMRLPRRKSYYFTSRPSAEFSNTGIGATIFNELNGSSHNTGINIAGSYHFTLSEDALSFLSVGVAVKAISNHYSWDKDLEKHSENTIFPNFDAGVYFYSSHLFAGVSSTNLLGNPQAPGSDSLYTLPVSLQLFFQIGYKFIISKRLNILIEPSLIINSDDSFSGELKNMIKPELKIYASNFCFGTFFNDYNKTSFFFQYKYPRFYIGTYFELPNDSPFYENPILAEIALGINISAIKSGTFRSYHW